NTGGPDALKSYQEGKAHAALPIDEQNVLNAGGDSALKSYQEGKALSPELQEAHRIYKTTGQVPQTKHPFAWIEMMEGRVMNRAERMDAMLAAQGKQLPVDTRYLTLEEFKDEVEAREKANEKSGWDKFKDVAKGVGEGLADLALESAKNSIPVY